MTKHPFLPETGKSAPGKTDKEILDKWRIAAGSCGTFSIEDAMKEARASERQKILKEWERQQDSEAFIAWLDKEAGR